MKGQEEHLRAFRNGLSRSKIPMYATTRRAMATWSSMAPCRKRVPTLDISAQSVNIAPDVTTNDYNEVARHLPVLLCGTNHHENRPAQMAHPEITIFVVPRKEGLPHASSIGSFIVCRLLAHSQLRASSNEPLHCNEGPDRERDDEEEQQEYCKEAER